MVNYKYNRTIRRSVAFEMPVKRRVVGGSEVAASEAFTNDGLHPTSRNPGSLNNWQNTNSNWFSISSCNDFGKGSENQEPGKSSIGWFPQVVCLLICAGVFCIVAILAGIAFKNFQ